MSFNLYHELSNNIEIIYKIRGKTHFDLFSPYPPENLI